MEVRRQVLAGYAAWVTLLIVVYYAVPSLRVEAWGLIGLTGIGAIVAGVRRNRPARQAPWLLLAAALAAFSIGQMSFLIAQLLSVRLPFPSFADGFYLLSYPLYAAGLLGFVAARSPHGDRRALIDGLTLTAGLALLSWLFLIQPHVHASGLTGWQRAVAIAYPLGDVLALALLARLLAPGTVGARSVQLLTIGAVACLVSDVAYGAIQLHGTFSNGGPTDLGWALFYTLLGAAALHPTMATLTEPVPRQEATVSPVRLAVLLLASLIAPVALLSFVPGGPTADTSVIAVFSGILYLLVLTRLWDAAASHRRGLDRERALRRASLALATAADVPQVADAVRDATAALLGPHSPGDALLGVLDDGTLRAVDGASLPGDGRLSRLAGEWLPLVEEKGAPVLTPVDGLPERAETARPGAGWMLLCPLTLSDSRDGELIGLLAVFGRQRRVLADMTATLEILAHQAARTLQSLLLRQEVIRQRNEAYFRAVVQDASDAIVIVGDDGTVKYATPSTAAIFGNVAAEGRRLWDLVADGGREELARTFRRLRQGARLGPRTIGQRITRLDGRSVYIQARCSDLRADPSVGGLVFTLRDVTEQHELEEQLKHRAFHDALTGLPNRLLFRDRIRQAVASAGRTGLVTGVLFVDLDDFKLVNDTMGHSAGDELLVAVTLRLASLVRDSDTAARLGGDEFAVLLTGGADAESADAAAERIVRAFAEPFTVAGRLVNSTVTVGVATTDDSTDTDDLLRHADLALYAAKAAGKRQWRRYQPVLSAGLVRRREIQAALDKAVAGSAFALVYQPIVDLATGALAGFEALIRWPHPQWGMLLPAQFIAVAEETGQIVPIGSWVLNQATADLAQWRRQPPDGGPERAAVPAARRDLYVSVNVSARQFADADFADLVRRVLDSSGLDPAVLMLELTETALLASDDRLLADLAALRDTGVRLAIDDFGTGYSTLSYLAELPVDVVKMDRSFVERIATPGAEQRLALATGIVQMAVTLGYQVIAEGIETEAQRDLLASMGCHYGQGYLLAMPMNPDEARELARTGFPAPAPPRTTLARAHPLTVGCPVTPRQS